MYNPNQSHPPPIWCRTASPRPRGTPARTPHSRDRAAKIRGIFLKHLSARATIDQVRVACLEAGLLEGVRHEHAQRNVVRNALASIAEPSHPW